jgi:predicted transcriptional regulator
LLLLSINPRFARLILRGEKTVELRRRAPRCSTDFWIALYATSPVRAIVGFVRALEVLVAPPDDLWPNVETGCALRREDYLGYYEGASRAVGIQLADPFSFETPMSLDTMRSSWPEFRPPRSFAYLRGERVQQVWSHAGLCTIGREETGTVKKRGRIDYRQLSGRLGPFLP